MTVVCATSGDLDSVKKQIAALEQKISLLTDRIAALEPAFAEVARPVDTDIKPPLTTVFVGFDGVTLVRLGRFITARDKGWHEDIDLQEAIRRMVRSGLDQTEATVSIPTDSIKVSR